MIGAFLIAVGWGVTTWDSKKAMDLWTAEVTFITKPIFNYFSNRAERMMSNVLDAAFEDVKPAEE